MISWIKKHRITFILLCILILFLLIFITIGIPFIINLLFKINSEINIFHVKWSAGEALSYYGAVLSFISTTTLSALALYQNHIIRKENNQKHFKENIPKFTFKFKGARGFCGNLSFELKNISSNIAYCINVYDIRMLKNTMPIWTSQKTFSFEAINPQEAKLFTLDSCASNEPGEIILVASLSCKDKYDIPHEYLLKMKCVHPNAYSCEKITEI